MTFAQFKTQYHLNLNPQQEEAVQALSGPVLLLAVPGSGKTTVLVSRIGYLIAQGVPPENILTMTYTVSAARDMSRRFAAFFGQPLADRLEFRTINGVCSRIIRAYERTQGRQAFQLLEDTGRQAAIIGEICRRQSGEFASESTVKAVQTAITYVKNSMISGEDLEQVEVEGVEFPPIYQEYCRLLRTHQLMDYDDQMIYAHRILKQFPQLLEQFRRRYPYLCVDEAQDTSKIQHAILRLLAGQNGNLFLVGDEDQSIYGFRAAYPQALTQFESIYPGAKVLYLEQNYRSTRPIVAAAQKFIEQNKNRRLKHMKAVRGEGPALKEIWVQDRNAQYRPAPHRSAGTPGYSLPLPPGGQRLFHPPGGAGYCGYPYSGSGPLGWRCLPAGLLQAGGWDQPGGGRTGGGPVRSGYLSHSGTGCFAPRYISLDPPPVQGPPDPYGQPAHPAG